VGIDHGGAIFKEYPADQVIFDNEAVILVPRWRSDVERLSKLRATVQKRAQALEQLIRDVNGELAHRCRLN